MKNNYHPIRWLIGLIILAAFYNLGVFLFFKWGLSQTWTSFYKGVLMLLVFAAWLITALYSIYQSVFSKRARNLFKFSSFLLILNGLFSVYTFLLFLKETDKMQFLHSFGLEWIFLIPIALALLDLCLWLVYKSRQKPGHASKKTIRSNKKSIHAGPLFFGGITLIVLAVLGISLYQVYEQSKASSEFFKQCQLDFKGYNNQGYAAIVCKPHTSDYQSLQLEYANAHKLANGKKEKITLHYENEKGQSQSMIVNIKVSGLKDWYDSYSSIPASVKKDLRKKMEENLDAVLSPGSKKDVLAGFYAPDPYLGGSLYSLYKETDTMNNTSYKIVSASKIAPEKEAEIQVADWYISNSNDGAFITDFMKNFNDNNKLEAIE